MIAGDFRNRTLEILRNGGAASCCWLSLGSAALAEIAAEQRPDAIVIDLQHGLWDVPSLHSGLLAAEGGATPLVRVKANAPSDISFALDAGAAGIIVPLVESAEEAAAAVAAAHYPPHGIRSGGGVRPLRDFAAYRQACSTQLLVSVMIETRAGFDNAAAIAAVEGIDLIFIGTGDLSLSLDDQAAFEPALAAILAACEEAGVPCGAFTGTAEEARARIAQGFRFVVAVNDLHLVRAGFASALAAATQDHPRS